MLIQKNTFTIILCRVCMHLCVFTAMHMCKIMNLHKYMYVCADLCTYLVSFCVCMNIECVDLCDNIQSSVNSYLLNQ